MSRLRYAEAVAAVLAAVSLVVLDAAIVNVALPAISRSLHVTPGQSVGVVTAYQLALITALLPCAALGESIGYRRVFMAGVAIFIGASVLCALSPSLPWLLAARFVQGLGGAAVMALGVALIRQVVPRERLGTAIGWNAMVVAFSAAAGPTLGAAVLSVSSWPWLFAMNLPIGLATMAACRLLPSSSGTRRPVDLVSAALNAGGFGCLVIGAEQLPSAPVMALALWISACALFAGLVRREASRGAPLIPLDLLRLQPLRVSVIASVCCFMGQAAALVSLPFYLRHALGREALETGLYMTPWPVAVMVTAPLAGRLSDQISGAWLCLTGGVLLAIGLALASIWPLHHDMTPLLPITLLCGVGFGLFQTPNNRNMYMSAPSERSGAAGGLQGTARLSGQTAGAVLMSTLFGVVSVDLAPRLGLGIGAGLALTAGLVSTLRR
ncbi:MFS transporter [Hyalangium versicolor]|uniref:MFS transporter n=1 Tax=Hyalangium versicolor TaxID=2861190 RepID=UPI001CCCDA25|nr:MFS transporter [Hyalangium versicolor]